MNTALTKTHWTIKTENTQIQIWSGNVRIMVIDSALQGEPEAMAIAKHVVGLQNWDLAKQAEFEQRERDYRAAIISRGGF